MSAPCNSAALGLIVLALGSSCALTAVARVVAGRAGLLDRPDSIRKSHTQPTPLLGGVAIYLSLLTTLLAAEFLGHGPSAAEAGAAAEVRNLVRMLLVSGGLFCLVGLWDDKRPLRARTKLLLQIAASLPFVLWGRSIESVHLLGTDIDLGLFGMMFTVFWLVACTNVINLADGLDGLAGTMGLIISLAIAALSGMEGMYGVMTIALLFAGSLLGFLLHNWPPAKIFLGDSGSLMIGFLVGALAIESSMKTATGFAMAVPLVLVSVPVFDTLMAIVRRKLTGRGIGEADRAHLHHCLQDRGLTRFQSLLAISMLCLVMAAVTLLSAYFKNDVLALGLCLSLLVLLILGRVFGHHEAFLFFRHIQALSLLFADTSGVLRTRLFLARLGADEREKPLDHWNELTRQVRDMGGFRLEFLYWNEQTDQVFSRLDWSSEGGPADAKTDGGAVWQFSYSLPDESDACATVTASGHSREHLKGQRLIDLFRVFDTFCRNWSAEAAMSPARMESPQIPLSPPQEERRVA